MADLRDRFDLMVSRGELNAWVSYLEDGLRCLKRNPYHRVLGKNFEDGIEPLAEWLVDFCQTTVGPKKKLGALYLEMNAFPINTDEWYCDLFGFRKAGDLEDLDWLSDPHYERPNERFVLGSMPSVQKAFAELYLQENPPLGVSLSAEIGEMLVLARFMQLVAAAHQLAKKSHLALDGVPVLATAHDWDTVHQST